MIKEISRKDREYLMHKHDMMFAAEKLFIDVGYHETTMDQIAEMAEYGKGTLYNYFENKEHLFFCILDEKLETYSIELATQVDKQSHLDEKLKAMVNYYFDFFCTNLGFFKIAQSEKYNLNSLSRENFINQLKQRYLTQINLISDVIHQNKHGKEELDLMAVSINGILNSLLTRSLFTKSKIDRNVLKQTALKFIKKLIK